MFVIRNTETGRYVTPPGSRGSYTTALQHARTWSTREAAERERCPGNERVLSVDEIMRKANP